MQISSSLRACPLSKKKQEIILVSKRPRFTIQEDDERQEVSKKAKVIESVSKQRVVLNRADCDPDFIIESNGLRGSSLSEGHFGYCWSGARANVGVNGGKYCFGCKIVSLQPVDLKETAPDEMNLCDLGISRGEDEPIWNYGYGRWQGFTYNSKFSDSRENFGLGDTVVCAVDLEDNSNASIAFSKNGNLVRRARFCLPEGRSTFFPHVLLKNVCVEMQFRVEDGLLVEQGFKPWASALEEGNAVIGPGFEETSACEIVVVSGTSASYKTIWAEKWVKKHPEKRYVLLGINAVFDQMKAPLSVRIGALGEWFHPLMARAAEIFKILLSRAATTHRNYIIDHAMDRCCRENNLQPFALFRKIGVTVHLSPKNTGVNYMFDPPPFPIHYYGRSSAPILLPGIYPPAYGGVPYATMELIPQFGIPYMPENNLIGNGNPNSDMMKLEETHARPVLVLDLWRDVKFGESPKDPEAEELRKEYPDYVPVIVENDARSDIPGIDEKIVHLVPGEMSLGKYASNISVVIWHTLDPIHVYFKKTVPPVDAIMCAIYAENKDDDGFLHLTYSGEARNASGSHQAGASQLERRGSMPRIRISERTVRETEE